VKPLVAVANPEKTVRLENHVRGPALSLEKCVGTAVRALRLRHQLTITQVAEGAGISAGMLSKIENGQISAGMDTLSRVARALGSTMAMLFRTYDVPTGAAHLVKRGKGMPFLRQGTRPGHTFEFISYDQGPTKSFDSFLVTISEASENLPTVEHPGTELIHVLEGVMEYRSGQDLYMLEPGDTLTLQGDVLHGFERLIELPIRFLCTIVYSTSHTDT
jgi:transcriptional regulator with XRE-family HTH domain